MHFCASGPEPLTLCRSEHDLGAKLVSIKPLSVDPREQELRDRLEELNYTWFRVATVIFGHQASKLRVLLERRKSGPVKYTLPSGASGVAEGLEAAARKVAADFTRGDVQLATLDTGARTDIQGGVTTCFVVTYEEGTSVEPPSYGDKSSITYGWHEVGEGGALSDRLDLSDFDRDLVRRAMVALADEPRLVARMLHRVFRIAELQQAVESVRGLAYPLGDLDKRNFRRKLEGVEWLVDAGLMSGKSAHRPAKLYEVRKAPGDVTPEPGISQQSQ